MNRPTISATARSDPFPETLDRLRARVERALDRYLPAADTPPTRLHEAMRYATLNGGKRIRACLVYAAGAAARAAEDSLDAPAAAVEIVHAYSLVHDDMPCMDDDELRRGKPTCHRAYDEATALLVGDALQTLAFEILATRPDAVPEKSLSMVTLLAQGINSTGMAGGQAIDLDSVGKTISLERLEDMHRRKTGALIRAAIRLGAAAGGTLAPEKLAALDDYARAVGLAFQVADDILDVTGSTEVLGKTAGADQVRNKPTYPAIMGLDGAKAYARSLHDAALKSLEVFKDNGDLLARLADYTIARTR